MNPMDAAPRDGTRFMALWPACDGDPEEWHETYWGRPDWVGRDGWATDAWWTSEDNRYAPTEWRPK